MYIIDAVSCVCVLGCFNLFYSESLISPEPAVWQSLLVTGFVGGLPERNFNSAPMHVDHCIYVMHSYTCPCLS